MGCTIACNGSIAHWNACVEKDCDDGMTVYNVDTLCFNDGIGSYTYYVLWMEFMMHQWFTSRV